MAPDQAKAIADFQAGLWVPVTVGSGYTVANRVQLTESIILAHTVAGSHYPESRFMSELDSSFKVATLAEARAECERRNSTLEKKS